MDKPERELYKQFLVQIRTSAQKVVQLTAMLLDQLDEQDAKEAYEKAKSHGQIE